MDRMICSKHRLDSENYRSLTNFHQNNTVNFLPKNLIIRSILPLVDEYLPLLDKAISEYREEWTKKFKIEEGEDIVCMLFSKEDKTYISILVLTADNNIRCQLETSLFSDFVKKLITLFKTTKNADNGKLSD